jgi:hypothetical protein
MNRMIGSRDLSPVSRLHLPPAEGSIAMSLMVAAILVTGRPSAGNRPK